MSDDQIWQLLRIVTSFDQDEAPLLALAIHRAIELPGTALSRSDLLNMLEEAESMLGAEQAIDLLLRTGLLDKESHLSPSFELKGWSFDGTAIGRAAADAASAASPEPDGG